MGVGDQLPAGVAGVSLVLSPQEIFELTRRSRASAQVRQLRHLNIPVEKRTDGTLVVLRVHVDSILTAATDTPKAEPRVRFD